MLWGVFSAFASCDVVLDINLISELYVGSAGQSHKLDLCRNFGIITDLSFARMSTLS